jgi:hypothetical protein
MNLKALIRTMQNKISPREELPTEAVLGFLRVLENVEEEEITCDELYAKLDEYVEREIDQKDAAKIMPLMRDHLDVCPECCDEYEALLHVVKETEEKK